MLLSGLLLTSSCSGFLERQSQDEVIVKTATDFSELLLGAGYVTVVRYEALYFMDDDLEIFENSYYPELHTVLVKYGALTWQPNQWEREYRLSDSYTDSYKRIMGVNAVLDGIELASGSQEDRDQVQAEALALRGFYYWMLVNLYAEPYHLDKDALGVPLKLSASLEENGMARNTVSEVYDRIVKDLTRSAELFDKYPKRRGNYRINSTSAHILLSRVYLYMERWADAIAAADKAINSAEGLTNYSQLANASDPVFMPDYNHSEVEWVYGIGCDCAFFGPSQDLLSKYDKSDYRPGIWFDLDRSQTIHLLKKDYDWTSGTTSPVNTLRISEAYLNRAEAYAMTQNAAQALADLNELKSNRIRDYQAVSENDVTNVLEEVRLERRRELCFDEIRWLDLRRYGKPSITHKYRYKMGDPWVIYTLKENDLLYTLPIPNAVVNENILLTQNPSAYEPERSGRNE